MVTGENQTHGEAKLEANSQKPTAKTDNCKPKTINPQSLNLKF